MWFETKRCIRKQFLIGESYAVTWRLRSLTHTHFTALIIVLLLTSCQGFFTIDAVTYYRNFSELELQECIVEDLGEFYMWLRYKFMVSFRFSLLDSTAGLSECLVSKFPNLKLKLNLQVTLYRLEGLLRQTPQLTNTEIGTCSSSAQLKSFFSGLWNILPKYLQIYFVCASLTSNATAMPDLVELLSRCQGLHKLCGMNLIEGTGLEANVALSEQGSLSVFGGCAKLESVLRLANAALVTVARKRVNIKFLCLCLVEAFAHDYKTYKLLDEYDRPYSRPESSAVERMDTRGFVRTIQVNPEVEASHLAIE